MKYLLKNKGIVYAVIEDLDVALLIQDSVNEKICEVIDDYEDLLFDLEEEEE